MDYEKKCRIKLIRWIVWAITTAVIENYMPGYKHSPEMVNAITENQIKRLKNI